MAIARKCEKNEDEGRRTRPNERYCKYCCEYDSIKGSSTGYCMKMPPGKGSVVGNETCKCGCFIPGQFKDRFRFRKEHQEKLVKRYAELEELNADYVFDTVPLSRLGGYLDGYEKGVSNATKWIPCSERLPESIDAVNITWVNRNPPTYYEHIKDKEFNGTAHYFHGKWYWYSSTTLDYLKEYGESEWDKMDEDIEVIAWMPLPKPYKEQMKGERNENKNC